MTSHDGAPTAVRGSFSDFRIIKGRKVAQLVLEIPIEQADEALTVLGGIPQPHSERWVGVARLNGSAKEPDPEPKEQRRWEDLKLSMQAGIRCSEEAFWQFLREEFVCNPADANEAANEVRSICGVDSRSGLNDNPEAAAKWKNLDGFYQAWLKVATG